MATELNTDILLASGTNELEIVELFVDEGSGYRGYYGVNAAKVIELIEYPDNVSKPPNAAHFVTGIFNHRGKVIILIDLSRWLGMEQSNEGEKIVVITEFNQATSAFLVSGVTRIHRTSWENIKPVDAFMQNYCDAITGMILLENRIVLMLDLEKIISELNPGLETQQLQADTASVTASETASSTMAYPIKIIHADDSGTIRRTTKHVLEENKEFAVTSVVDGKLAWEYLEKLKKKAAEEGKPVTDYIDAILSDIEMPGMDGYHLCLKVKSDPELKALPFVLFSSLITDKLRHKGESVGADAQLAKPNPKELVIDLKNVVSKLGTR